MRLPVSFSERRGCGRMEYTLVDLWNGQQKTARVCARIVCKPRDKLAFPFCRGVGSWSEPSHGWATTVASLGTGSIHAEAWIKIAMITLWCEGSPEHSQTGSKFKAQVPPHVNAEEALAPICNRSPSGLTAIDRVRGVTWINLFGDNAKIFEKMSPEHHGDRNVARVASTSD